MSLSSCLRALFRRRGGTMPKPRPLVGDEVRVVLSPGWVELPPGSEGQFTDDFLKRLNQRYRKPTA